MSQVERIARIHLTLGDACLILHARKLDSQRNEDIRIFDIESVANIKNGNAHQEQRFNLHGLAKRGSDMDLKMPLEYRKYEFLGGLTIRELRNAIDSIPEQRGIYLVARSLQIGQCEVLERSSGGFYKDKDPTVDADMLRGRVLQCHESPIMYIGKAGGTGMATTLRERIKQYLKFGEGKRVSHRGGRYIWQLAEAESLLVFWRPETCDEPRDVERRLIRQHEDQFGWLPFANLAH